MFWRLLLCCAIIKLALCEVESQTQCESPDKVEATTPFTPSEEQKTEENEMFKREVGLPGPCPRTGEPICKCGLNCLRECDDNASSPCECSSCPPDTETAPSELEKLSCDLENSRFSDFPSFCQDCGWGQNSQLRTLEQPFSPEECPNNPIVSEQPISHQSYPQNCLPEQYQQYDSRDFHPLSFLTPSPCEQICDRLPRKCFDNSIDTYSPLEQPCAPCVDSIPGSPLEQPHLPTFPDLPCSQCQCDVPQKCISSCNRPLFLDTFPPVPPHHESSLNYPRLPFEQSCDFLPQCFNPCKRDIDQTQPLCSCPQNLGTSPCECNPFCQSPILANHECQPICDSKPLCPCQQNCFDSSPCECSPCFQPSILANQECQPICDSKPLCPCQQNCFDSSPCDCHLCQPPILANQECQPIYDSKPLCPCQQNCFDSSPCDCHPCQPPILANQECQPIYDSKPLCPCQQNGFDSSPCECNLCCQPQILANQECQPICDSKPLCPCQNCFDSSPCIPCCQSPNFLNPECHPIVPHCDSKPFEACDGCPFQCGCPFPCEGQISRIRPVVIECVRQIPIVQNSIHHQQEFFTREVPIVESHVTQKEEQILRHVPIVHKFFEPILESRTRFVPVVVQKQRTVSEPCLTHVPIVEKRLKPVQKCVVEQVPVFEKRCVPVALQTVRKIPVTERICRPVVQSHITQIPVKERIVKNFVERLCYPGPCCHPGAQLPPCPWHSCDLPPPCPCPSPF